MVRYEPPSGHGTVVLAHGGGYTSGSVDDSESIAMACSRALGIGATVLDVDYRLAPEHPFPAAVDDVTAVIREVEGPVVLNGVSSGAGILAGALTALPTGTADGVVLEIPSVDLRPDAPWLSEFDTGLAPRSAVRDQYLQGADSADPRASPAAAELSHFPPAYVLVAEHDPLRAVGERFAAALPDAELDVVFGATHGSHLISPYWNRRVNAVIRQMLNR